MTKIKPEETSASKGLRKTTDGHKRITCHLLTEKYESKKESCNCKIFFLHAHYTFYVNAA